MNREKRLEVKKDVKEWVERYGGDRGAVLPALEEAVKKYKTLEGYILQEIAHEVGIHPSEVYGTSTFYSFLGGGREGGRNTIRLCKTISCHMKGKDRIARQLINELGIDFGETTPDGEFSLEYCNCLGMCDQGPALLVNDTLVSRVKPHEIPEIIEGCRKGIKGIKEEEISKFYEEGPVLQERIVPEKMLAVVLEKDPSEILREIEDAELRGRGGAGFSTGLKWRLAMEEDGERKYVICNADEGEPGTFKDRFLLHRHLDTVLQGMCIGAYVVGATKGYIYLRGEYSYLRDSLEKRIEEWRERNLLGGNILRKGSLTFDIEIRMGAGAYICGEETALIESMEGKRGEPRNKPPFPIDTGFMGNPTIVNNVETFFWAAIICNRGVEFFKRYGTDRSKGSKFFSISGDCEKEGIYEFPMGITIEEVVDYCRGERIKAVQVGGAAGECIPQKDFQRRIAYEAVPTGGSIILFNEDRDMLDVAENFVEFFVEESCGQCTPCREGTYKVLEGIRLLKKGRCSVGYLETLMELADTVERASKCGLGQMSMKAFKSIVLNFKEEVYGRLPEEGRYGESV